MNALIPQNIEELSKAEQLALSKSLLHRLETTLEEMRENPEKGAMKLSRSQPSPELPQLIGNVIISASWAEDAGGTLIQASSEGWEVRAKGYDDTSSTLVKALKKHVPKELIERLETALKLRHFVVHGFFVGGGFMKNEKTGEPYEFLSMKRSYRTEAPQREIMPFSSDTLRWLANEFWEIEAELEDLHSVVLGIRNADDEGQEK